MSAINAKLYILKTLIICTRNHGNGTKETYEDDGSQIR